MITNYLVILTEAGDYLTTDAGVYIDQEPLIERPIPVPLFAPVKVAYSGFHCFIRHAIDNLKAGAVVYKNPVTGSTF